ncbi:S1C family serine protease [Rhodovibrionaceae bacterium A322]
MGHVSAVIKSYNASILALALLFALPACASDTDLPPTSETSLDAVIGVHAFVPSQASTAKALGEERSGSAVVIDAEEGLILTTGYLVIEAAAIELELQGGRRLPANLLAYDFESGLGLLESLAPLPPAELPIATSDSLKTKTKARAVIYDQGLQAKSVYIAGRRPFAGWWEYYLDSAIYTTPPIGAFGGAALVDDSNNLVGMGLLVVGDSLGQRGQPDPIILPGNLFVPLDDMPAILEDLKTNGRRASPPNPWLGLYLEESQSTNFKAGLRVNTVVPNGPSNKAGIQSGDFVTKLGGQPVTSLGQFYQDLWSLGSAGVEVPLTLTGPRGTREVRIQSAYRNDFLQLESSF